MITFIKKVVILQPMKALKNQQTAYCIQDRLWIFKNIRTIRKTLSNTQYISDLFLSEEKAPLMRLISSKLILPRVKSAFNPEIILLIYYLFAN